MVEYFHLEPGLALHILGALPSQKRILAMAECVQAVIGGEQHMLEVKGLNILLESEFVLAFQFAGRGPGQQIIMLETFPGLRDLPLQLFALLQDSAVALQTSGQKVFLLLRPALQEVQLTLPCLQCLRRFGLLHLLLQFFKVCRQAGEHAFALLQIAFQPLGVRMSLMQFIPQAVRFGLAPLLLPLQNIRILVAALLERLHMSALQSGIFLLQHAETVVGGLTLYPDLLQFVLFTADVGEKLLQLLLLLFEPVDPGLKQILLRPQLRKNGQVYSKPIQLILSGPLQRPR